VILLDAQVYQVCTCAVYEDMLFVSHTCAQRQLDLVQILSL